MYQPVDIPTAEKVYAREYASLGGADFFSSDMLAFPSRSPDCRNVYRDYSPYGGGAITTRPGFSVKAVFSGKVDFLYPYENALLVAAGGKLYLWENFPDTPATGDISLLSEDIGQGGVSAVNFNGYVCILCGSGLFTYGENGLKSVTEEPFVPKTRINASPDGGGGEAYQSVNLLSPLRENSFCGDGESSLYRLDATNLDAAEVFTITATVDGVALSEGNGFSVDRIAGSVSFTASPSDGKGSDNVIIRFSKTVSGECEKITSSRAIVCFDNRVFVGGNPDYPARVFVCALDNIAYFPDDSFYDDGYGTVRSLIVDGEALYCIKKSGSEDQSFVYSHIPSLDNELGKVYPACANNITEGAISEAVSFNGEAVYAAESGIAAISGRSGSLKARRISELVDKKLRSEEDYSLAFTAVWNNYLVVACGASFYLADGRSSAKDGRSTYEWYVWDGIGHTNEGVFSKASCIACVSGKLYFGSEDGRICCFDSTNDDGSAIVSYWTTPLDMLGEAGRKKSLVKNGNALIVRRFANSMVKIAVKTEKSAYREVCCCRTAGFTFAGVDFSLFSFGTGAQGAVSFPLKEKNFRAVSLKFYSDEADKPFGIYQAVIRYKVKGPISG